MHPWQRARIDQERVLMQEYGLKNKKEIWKMLTQLKDFAVQAKKFVALNTPQSEKEKQALLAKLKRYGILGQEGTVTDILSLDPKIIMERRLQTLVYRKGYARSIDQARQFVKHEHVMVAGKKISVPSYLVSLEEESQIAFSPSSSLSAADHPERQQVPKGKGAPA